MATAEQAVTKTAAGKATVYKNFINGEWVESHTGRTFENLNPADTRDVVGVFQRSDAEDVNRAIDAASEAYKKWRLVPAPRRAEMLYKASEILIGRKEEYAQLMTREMGKVIKETRGDVQEAIDCGYYTAGEGRRLFGPTVPSELPNKFAMAVRQPLGVCAMITPWNFPMAIPSWKLFPALVAGNTAVIKPAQDTPLSTFNFVQALTDGGVPAGVVNIVSGYGDRGGHADDAACGGARGVADGLDGGGTHRRTGSGQDVQALLAGVGREESDDRARRREPRIGAGRRTVGLVRDDRTALHGDEPHHSAEGRVSQVCGRAGGARAEAEGRQRAG